MGEEQPTFKVVDRRPFNPDGTPRELSPEEQREAERVAESLKIPAVEKTSAASAAPNEEPATPRHPPPEPLPPEAQTKTRSSGDPLDEIKALRLVPAERDVEPAARQRAALRGQDIAGNEVCVVGACGTDRR